jgi:hypothetical protein
MTATAKQKNLILSRLQERVVCREAPMGPDGHFLELNTGGFEEIAIFEMI